MKNIISTLVLSFSCSFLMAQTEFDALKYVQTDISGTARYLSMAGAFGALGGDPSAIKDNPAGLGIYRKSEMVGTINMLSQNTNSNWQFWEGPNLKNSHGYGDVYKFGATNFSLILASPNRNLGNSLGELVGSNWSFSYNRLKNFDRNLNIRSGLSTSSISDYLAYFSKDSYPANFEYSGNNISSVFNNPYVPTLSVYGYQGYLIDSVSPGVWKSSITNKITPAYRLAEKGHLDEYSIGWAGNIDNLIYIGTTLNYQTLDYSAISTYSENFGSQGNMSLGDTIYTKGSGVNLNIGAIFRPSDNLRIGVAIHTPTLMALTDRYYSTFNYNRTFLNGDSRKGTIVGPSIPKKFDLQSPMQINLSAAYFIDNKGLISAEYVISDYIGTRFRSDIYNFTNENDGMKETLNNVKTFKLGGEYKPTNNISLRAGYANTANVTRQNAEKFIDQYTKRVDTEYFLHNYTTYLTTGFGYRKANWYIDFAYMYKIIDETFSPYRSSQLEYLTIPATVITANNNASITLGLRF